MGSVVRARMRVSGESQGWGEGWGQGQGEGEDKSEVRVRVKVRARVRVRMSVTSPWGKTAPNLASNPEPKPAPSQVTSPWGKTASSQCIGFSRLGPGCRSVRKCSERRTCPSGRPA